MKKLLAEQKKYEVCYLDPEYKLGPYRRDNTLDDITDLIAEYGPFERHIDISAGRGEVIDHVKKFNIHSQGTEIVEDLLRDDIQFAWSHELPFKDGEFDFLTNCDAMEHYLPEMTEQILDEFFRVVEGVAYLTISNNRATKHEMELHINIKSYIEWQTLLSKYGKVTPNIYGRNNPTSMSFTILTRHAKD
jgi:hypothetical protein